uniref:Dynein regulatory complex subunit 3 n=1 Tax=Cyclopterus lumpus TaxID=8103 RepID=A0A8C3APE5_CYCLU
MSGHMEKENLMDEEMLQKAIVEQAAQDQVGRVVKVEGIHFNEIPKLRLDYRNILMIDHLWEFTSLARLDLNNNLIEKIEGLDRLINLTWLNLSFNRIEKIEGLGSLRKLEVLNLSNNSISVIENMDTLEKLSHFLIEHLCFVLYLRTFKNLFTVNLYGNPVSQEDDYKLSIAAYFPKLSCLDYRLLDEKTNEASLKYGYVLDKIKREELQRQRAEEVKQSQEEAFVESLNGSHLFKSMLKDDPEALHSVPQVAHMLQTYPCQMVELCMQLFETGLAEHKQRETEVNSFSGGQNEAVTHYQQKASHIFTDFEQRRKAEIHQLCNSLMALEFQLISQLEDNIKKLDINISDMIGNFSETAQGIYPFSVRTFAQCRDLEDNYHEKVRGVIASTLEDVAKDNREKAVPDRDEMMLVDKDTVMDALATSHDNHLQMINDRETQLMTRADAWKVALVKGIEEKELKRNRMRISDIHRYADHLLEQLEELHLPP